MSLINDALKKAQKDRTPGPAAPTPPRGPAVPPGFNRGGGGGGDDPDRKNFPSVVFAVCSTLVFLGLATVISIYLLRREPSAPPAVANTAPAPAPAPARPKAEPAPVPTPAPQPAAESSVASLKFELPPPPPLAINTSPEPTPAVAPARTATATPATAPDAPTEAAPPPMAFKGSRTVANRDSAGPGTSGIPKHNPRIFLFIEKLRVTGIRLNPPKVILNDRLFQEHDVIEPALNLRLTRIENRVLTFVDEQGLEYYKTFN